MAQDQAVAGETSNDVSDVLSENFSIKAKCRKKVSEYNIAVGKLNMAVGGAWAEVNRRF